MLRFFTISAGMTGLVLQILAAVIATFVPMLEKLGMDGEVNTFTVKTYIWTKTIVGTVKAVAMVSVFIINGLSNDFYIALFFFSTTTIGMLYFYMNPCLDPVKHKGAHETFQVLEAPLRQIQYKINADFLQQHYQIDIIGAMAVKVGLDPTFGNIMCRRSESSACVSDRA